MSTSTNHDINDDDDLPPQLDDFQAQLKTIHVEKKPAAVTKPSQDVADYTKPNTRHLQDQAKLAEEIQKMNLQSKKIQQSLHKKQQPPKKNSGYGGMKKGFLSGGSGGGNKKASNTTPTITQVKPNVAKSNPLQFKQVQDAMKMNNYLDSTRNQWMTNNFLDTVTKNEKVSKLFTNPEYMKGIDMFKTNPKEAMAKYGQNKEFMQGFQEFCKLMGGQFQSLGKQQQQQQKK